MSEKDKNELEKVCGFAGLKRYLEEVYEKPIAEIELPDIEESVAFGQSQMIDDLAETNCDEIESNEDVNLFRALQDDMLDWRR